MLLLFVFFWVRIIFCIIRLVWVLLWLVRKLKNYRKLIINWVCLLKYCVKLKNFKIWIYLFLIIMIFLFLIWCSIFRNCWNRRWLCVVMMLFFLKKWMILMLLCFFLAWACLLKLELCWSWFNVMFLLSLFLVFVLGIRWLVKFLVLICWILRKFIMVLKFWL